MKDQTNSSLVTLVNISSEYDEASEKIVEDYKKLVEIRRVRLDVLISIINNKILIKDRVRLYRFLSFIMNKEIDKNNYKDYLDEAREYVLSKYPNLLDIEINNIDDKNKDYGINYFYFNRIDEDITDLKYLSNKSKVKQ